MEFGKYRFSGIILDKGRLPLYKGSTFRGALGHALRKTTCVVSKTVCADCMLQSSCVYASLFEVQAHWNELDQARVVTPPHPYVIEPPLYRQTEVSPGDAFDFNILLFGAATRYLPYLVYACEKMGQAGLGRSGQRVRFSVSEVSVGDKTIYRKAEGKLLEGPWTSPLTLAEASKKATGLLTVKLQTPLRLKFENRFQGKLPFHLLVRALLRRVSSLGEAFGDGEPALDYRGLIQRAEGVSEESADLKWNDINRYSSRQQQKLRIGGVTGCISYRGELTEYLPLLDFGRQVHIGKQTTFGLGKFTYHWQELSS